MDNKKEYVYSKFRELFRPDDIELTIDEDNSKVVLSVNDEIRAHFLSQIFSSEIDTDDGTVTVEIEPSESTEEELDPADGRAVFNAVRESFAGNRSIRQLNLSTYDEGDPLYIINLFIKAASHQDRYETWYQYFNENGIGEDEERYAIEPIFKDGYNIRIRLE